MISNAKRAANRLVAAGWFTRIRETAEHGGNLPSRYVMTDSLPAGMEAPPWEDASKIKETIIRLAGEA